MQTYAGTASKWRLQPMDGILCFACTALVVDAGMYRGRWYLSAAAVKKACIIDFHIGRAAVPAFLLYAGADVRPLPDYQPGGSSF